jgi:hypothetical protein
MGQGTGGIITYYGGYVVHTFLSDGTFDLSGTGVSSVDVLVVGGGGGGGANCGGGGGAGGVRYFESYPVLEQSYPITVGLGGAGGSSSVVSNGENGGISQFDTIISAGGGGGGGDEFSGSKNGLDGGSGGGGWFDGVGGNGNIPVTVPAQGNAGGNGDGEGVGGGGGGGAGGAGENGAGEYGGNGGSGISYSISGTSIFYGGGGGGGGFEGGGLGGSSVGGQGGGESVSGGSAVVNRGSGGGGSGFDGDPGGSGSSGIVIIRYSSEAPTTTTTTTVAPTTTTAAPTTTTAAPTTTTAAPTTTPAPITGTLVKFTRYDLGIPSNNVLWSFGDGATSTSLDSTVFHSYASSGDYTTSLEGWSIYYQYSKKTKVVTIPVPTTALFLATSENEEELLISSSPYYRFFVDIDTDVNLTCLCYAKNMWVGANQFNANLGIYSSTDKAHWTKRLDSSLDSINWRQIIYSQRLDLFIAVGGQGATYPDSGLGYAALSSDGINWDVYEVGYYGLFSIAENDDCLVATGWGRSAYRSTNGIDWDLTLDNFSSYISAITWDGSKFIAVPVDSPVLWTSVDGITWDEVESGYIGFYTFDVVAMNGIYYACGGGGLFWSEDLLSWTEIDSTTLYRFNILDGELFVGGDKILKMTSDKVFVELPTAGPTKFITKAPYTSIIDPAADFIWSVDDSDHKKINFIDKSLGRVVSLNTDFGDSTSNNSGDRKFSHVYADYDATYSVTHSILGPDGTAEVTKSVTTGSWIPSKLNRIIYSSRLGLFVGVGDESIIMTSSNGSDWDVRNSGGVLDFYDVVDNGTTLVAVGDQDLLSISSDGVSWSFPTTGLPTTNYKLTCVIWDGSIFVVCCCAEMVGTVYFYTSADGSTWSLTGDSINNIYSHAQIVQYDSGYYVGGRSTDYVNYYSIYYSTDLTGWDVCTLNSPYPTLTYTTTRFSVINGDLYVSGALISCSPTLWMFKRSALKAFDSMTVPFEYNIPKDIVPLSGSGPFFCTWNSTRWFSQNKILKNVDLSSSWTSEDTTGTGTATLIASSYNGTTFVASSDSSKIFNSSDGVTWTQVF